MSFNGNETDNSIIDSIFSGNDQQKVYNPKSVLKARFVIEILLSFLN